MVDFHKGFEGFERLGPSGKKKKEDEISFSEHGGEEKLTRSASDMVRGETLYVNMLEFVTSTFDKVAEGRESSIKGEDILGWTQEFTECIQKYVSPDDLVRLVFKHDEYEYNYIYTHSVNVCLLTVRLALALNFTKSKLTDILIASLFHDIGMMKIPVSTWNREGKLSPEENEELKKHAVYGQEIFKDLKGISDTVGLIIAQHQERVDGTGYPDHLTKDDIHYGARLVALLDRYEAQTHTRLWGARELPDKAIQSILDNESKKFDPHYIKALLKHISIFPVGSWVRISSGEIGQVVRINEDTPMRPVINVVFDRERNRREEERVVDLSKQLLIHAENCVDPSELE